MATSARTTVLDLIEIGKTPNDGTGDSLRDAFIKVNANFSTIEQGGGVVGAAGTNEQVQFNTFGSFNSSENFTWNDTDNILSATNFSGSGALLTNLNASRLTTGSINLALIGTGIPDASTYLRGDGTWVTVPQTPPAGTDRQLQFNNNGAFGADPELSWNSATSTLVAANFSGAGNRITALNGSNITSGTIAPARLGGGTPSANTFLRGDGVWVDGLSAQAGGSTNQIQFNINGAFTSSPYLTWDPATITLTAANFSGNGAGLVGLNASNLTTGTVPPARLGSGTASAGTYLRGDGSWGALQAAGANTNIQFNNSGAMGANSEFTFTPATVTVSARKFMATGAGFVGEGSGLLNLDGGQITFGTIAPARLGSGTTNASTYLRGDGTWGSAQAAPGGVSTQVQFNNNGVLDGNSNFTWTTSTGTLTATNFVGNGSGLTNLNADRLVTGVVSTSRLGSGIPSTSTYLRGDGSWASIPGGLSIGGVNTQIQFNSSNALAGSSNLTWNSTTNTLNALNFNGNGSAITALNGSNISSGTVAAARLGSGTASSSTYLRGDGTWTTIPSAVPGGTSTQLQFNNAGSFSGDAALTWTAGTATLAATNFSGNGSALTNLNANNITGGTVDAARLGSGTANSGTYLRGDNTWGPAYATAGGSTTQVQFNNSGALGGSANFVWDNATNTLSVTNITGSGNALTNLNASNISSGTVPSARLGSGTASTSTFLRGDGTWTSVPASFAAGGVAGQIQFNAANLLVGSTGLTWNAVSNTLTATNISGNGSAITALNASNISSGTVAPARLGTGTASASNYLRGDGTWTSVTPIPGGATTQLQFNNAGVLDGSASLTWTAGTATLAATNFSGNGSLMTSLNADNLSSGTVPFARLLATATGSASVNTFLSGAGTWTTPVASQTGNSGKFLTTNGSSTSWSAVSVTPAGATTEVQFNNAGVLGSSSTFTWSGTTLSATNFSGNGSALTSLNANNLASGTVATARLGTGTASATTYLRGDGTWANPAGGSVTSVAISGGTTGLTTSGGPITSSGTITLAGTLAVANGGTGATTQAGAANAMLPTQTGNSGKYLTTDGTNVSWATVTTGITASTNVTWSAAQRGLVTALTYGTTITPNFDSSNNFSVTLTGNANFSNPSTTLVPGQSGIIAVTQDATGSRTLTWGSYYVGTGGIKPSLSTAAGAIDLISYYVVSTTKIFVASTLAIA